MKIDSQNFTQILITKYQVEIDIDKAIQGTRLYCKECGRYTRHNKKNKKCIRCKQREMYYEK